MSPYTAHRVRSSAPDADLVFAASHGDDAAAAELFRRHHDSVTAICRHRLRNDHDAADATQEAFARALSSLATLRDADRFGPWLRTIAVNVCQDTHRRTRYTDELDEARAAVTAGADEEVLSRAEAERVHARLATLSARDARALWLRDADELSIPAVAADLGVTEGSARVLLVRARKRFRAAYRGFTAPVFAFLASVRGRFGRSGVGGWDPSVLLAGTAVVVAAVGVGQVAFTSHDPMRLQLERAHTVATPLPSDAPASIATAAPVAVTAVTATGPSVTPPVATSSPTADPSPVPSRPEGAVVVTAERPEERPQASVSTGDGEDDLAVLLFTGELIEDPLGGAGGGSTTAQNASRTLLERLLLEGPSLVVVLPAE